MLLRVKKVSVLILAVLLVYMSAFSAFAAQSESIRTVFGEDFESYPVGMTTLNGYGGGSKGNEWKISQESDGSNQYYLMHVNTSSDMHLDKTLSEVLNGNFVVQMDLYFEDYIKDLLIF